MPDPNQYPASVVQRNDLPTCSGYIVTKFQPTTKYRSSEEEIEDESGILGNIVGTDDSATVEIELIPTTSLSSIVSLQTVLPFVGLSSFPELTRFATGTADQINLLVRGDVKPMGKVGGAKRIGITGFVNSVIPTQT